MCFLKAYSRDEDDEIREFCLQACEAFVYRCSEGIGIHIPLVNYYLKISVFICIYYIHIYYFVFIIIISFILYLDC